MKVSVVRVGASLRGTITFKRCKTLIWKSKGGSESHALLQHIDHYHGLDIQGQSVKPSTIIAPLLSNFIRMLVKINRGRFIISDLVDAYRIKVYTVQFDSHILFYYNLLKDSLFNVNSKK